MARRRRLHHVQEVTQVVRREVAVEDVKEVDNGNILPRTVQSTNRREVVAVTIIGSHREVRKIHQMNPAPQHKHDREMHSASMTQTRVVSAQHVQAIPMISLTNCRRGKFMVE